MHIIVAGQVVGDYAVQQTLWTSIHQRVQVTAALVGVPEKVRVRGVGVRAGVGVGSGKVFEMRITRPRRLPPPPLWRLTGKHF